MRNLRVLLVEDDPADVELVRRAMDLARLRCDLEVRSTAQEALATIGRDFESGQREIDAVLLDLGLPDQPGLKLLEELEANRWREGLPVFALTADRNPETVEAVYRHGATSFMNKPLNVSEFVDLLRAEGFWLTLAR